MSILKTNSTDFKCVGFVYNMYLDLGISIFENENQIIGVVVDSSSHPKWEGSIQQLCSIICFPKS